MGNELEREESHSGDDDDDNNGNEDKSEEVDINSEGEVELEEITRVDIRALAYSLRFAKTADDVEKVLKDMDELPLQVHSRTISGLGRDKYMDAAKALVEWLKRKKNESSSGIGLNRFIYNSLLGAVKHSKQFGEMKKILEDMSEEGIIPNIVTYNALMAIYLEQGETTKALNVLEEIQEKGFGPSPVSYFTALLAYRRMEDGNGALKFFVELREKYVKGDIGKNANENWEYEFVKFEKFTVHIYQQVMWRWFVKDENLSTNVLKLVRDMDNAGVKLSRADYERLIWACIREEHYVVAKELVAGLEKAILK